VTKVLFLDIDGVMNNSDHLDRGEEIGEEFLDRLKTIINLTGAEIVLSSTWRLFETNRKQVRQALATRNLDFIDVTKEIRGPKDEHGWHTSAKRSVEILEWLMRHPEVEKFAVIDDDPDAEVENHFFQTSFKVGLTFDIVEKVVHHLGIAV